MCKFAIDGNCQISTDMAGIAVPLHDGACQACKLLPDAMTPGNHVVTDRACWMLLQVGQRERAYALRLASNQKRITREAGTDLLKAERRQKVAQGKERKARLISWLKFFRAETDIGLGDTADRLRRQRKKSPVWISSDAHNAIKRLLAQCSCSRVEAVARLNKEYPY